jgi:Toastrack DUF4097
VIGDWRSGDLRLQSPIADHPIADVLPWRCGMRVNHVSAANGPGRRRAALYFGFAVAFAAAGCIDVIGADANKYVEREDKHFAVSGTPDVRLATFDGAIEIRSWDKADVHVVVEKRGASKEAVDTIEVQTQHSGNSVTVEARVPKSDGFDIHFNNFRSAKLIVSVPEHANIVARSGDGSIDAERVTGRVELRSGDGAIRARDLDGPVKVQTGDGSIALDAVSGSLDVQTGDGSVRARGRFTSVRARTCDGSVAIRADSGSKPTDDWDITTGDGSITFEVPDDFGGELDAHTGDGRVRLSDLTLSNVTGEIGQRTVRGRLGSGGPNIRLRTGDGSITLRRATGGGPMTAEKPQ